MAHSTTNSNPFRAPWRKKFHLNLRPQRQIHDSKQAHPNIAEIYTESIHAGRCGEHLHGRVQQLAFPATPVLFGGAFENHLVSQ